MRCLGLDLGWRLGLLQPQFSGEGAQAGGLLVFEDRRGRPPSRPEEDSDEDLDDVPARLIGRKRELQSRIAKLAQDRGSDEEENLEEGSDDDDEDAPEALPSKDTRNPPK